MERTAWTLVLALCCLLAAVPLAAQVMPLDDSVRVTLKDGASSQIHGRLIGISPDSLTLRLADGNALTLDRRAVKRVERHRKWNVGLSVAVGCVALGGVLGGLGSQMRDPDSPGIERAFAAVGFVAGCAIGALGGMLAAAGGGAWQEVSL